MHDIISSCKDYKVRQALCFVGSRRAQGIALLNKKKTVCIRGHPLTPENVYVRKDGKRRCKTCEKDFFKRRRRSVIDLSGFITII